MIDSFAAILVRVVDFKEIYQAWEKQYKSDIDDFKESEHSKPVAAKQTEWIEQVPKVLCMQMNRLNYSTLDNEAQKLRHRVAIEKTLYVDRYMIENKTKSEQLQDHVHKLREQIQHLEASIKEFTSFGGSEYDIRKIFQLMNTFFTQ